MKARSLLLLAATLVATMLTTSHVLAESKGKREPLTTIPKLPVGVPHNEPKPVATVGGGDINVSNLVGNEAEVMIVVNPMNPNNLVIVGHSPNHVSMNTFYSTDGGRTWTRVALGQAQDGLTVTFRADPTVAFSDDGDLYVGYLAVQNETSPYHEAVVVCKSTDGGQTYTQCTQVVAEDWTNILPHDKEQLATGPDRLGQVPHMVYLAWTRNVQEGGDIDKQIVVSASNDGGLTFSQPVIVADDAIYGTDLSLFADPAVGMNGDVFVVWWDYDPESASYIRFDRSLDLGVNWGQDQTLTFLNITDFSTFIPAQPYRGITPGPTIDTNRGTGGYSVYLVYADAQEPGSDDIDIFFKWSENGGVSWRASRVLNDDGGTNSQFLPWLDVDQQTGWVSVVWYDARNDPNNQLVDLFMTASGDGLVFQPNVRISDGSSDQSVNNPGGWENDFLEYIGLASHDRVAYAVWADNSTDPSDLDFFFDRVNIPLTVCGTCTESQNYVTAQREFTNNSGQDVNDLEFRWTNETFGNNMTGAVVAKGSPFNQAVCVATQEVDVLLGDGVVPDGSKVTVEGTVCQNGNQVVWKNIHFTVDDEPVFDVPSSGFRVALPIENAGLFGHDIEILNYSLTPLQLRNLEAVADVNLVSDLDFVSFSGPTHVVLVGSTPEPIPENGLVLRTYKTDSSFLGGYVYLRYEISNVETPNRPKHWDEVIAVHIVGPQYREHPIHTPSAALNPEVDGSVTEVVLDDFSFDSAGGPDPMGWTGVSLLGVGDFAALYKGTQVIQEGSCPPNNPNNTNVWGFFDDPANTNYACGGFPLQGAIPFGIPSGLTMDNEIWSPFIEFAGQGSSVILSYDVYADLPLDNLVFYRWRIRSVSGGNPGPWKGDDHYYYSGVKGWSRVSHEVGALIDPGATDVQLSLGVLDLCRLWCGIYGSGACHSHAPLFDNVTLVRRNTVGPQYSVRHLDLFQDNFADDGTTTGTARIDCANDVLPSANPAIRPGDSLTVTISEPSVGLGTDPTFGGVAAYVYVAVRNGGVGWNPDAAQAPELDNQGLIRWPKLPTPIVHDGVTWWCYRMDFVWTNAGGRVPDRWCFDLNDAYFVPGDTIRYVFCAKDMLGNEVYFSRRLDGQGANFTTTDRSEVLDSPLEATILPAGGWRRGGDILYVDDADDREGPVQLYFDTAFELLGLDGLVDRFDVMGPSSVLGNGPGARVENIATQILGCYRKIIWCSGNLSSGLIGDGTGHPEKSDDFGLLFAFLDQHTDNPGLYISGDDVAEEWVTLGGAAATLRSNYMNFNLINGSHVDAGEAVSPCLVATGPGFVHLGVPDSLIAFGGCSVIGDFDVLQPTGLAVTEVPYPNVSGSAVISQTTPNSGGSVAGVILSGFSYHSIRDKRPGFPPARVEHLRDILIWLQDPIQVPVAIGDEAPVFANRLDNNYPNPFNPTTKIVYSIKHRGPVSLKVYNVAGQLIRTLVNEEQNPQVDGFTVTWDGRNNAGQSISSGVYFYELVAKNFSQSKKMVLLK